MKRSRIRSRRALVLSEKVFDFSKPIVAAKLIQKPGGTAKTMRPEPPLGFERCATCDEDVLEGQLQDHVVKEHQSLGMRVRKAALGKPELAAQLNKYAIEHALQAGRLGSSRRH